MGIRFRCPSGHKLHVKDFLAGKRGICPKCGAKFQIPLESEPEPVKDPKRPEAEPNLDASAPTVEVEAAFPEKSERSRPVRIRKNRKKSKQVDKPVTPEKSASLPELPEQASTSTSPATTDEVVSPAPSVELQEHGRIEFETTGSSKSDSNLSETVVVPETSEATPSTQPIGNDSSNQQDPITEAPHAVWYVRPPSGGQFGPASGDIMRSWMSEGRITVDSMVWREGWPEWKQAGKIFPGLVGPTPNAAIRSEIPQIVTESTSGASLEMYRRRKSTKNTLSIVLLLIVACLILAGTLFYVLKFMN